MDGEPDLVGLLHRVDWTRLRLSAELDDGSTVLLAPGRRYRRDTSDHVTGCDGDRPWELYPDFDNADGSTHWISGPEAPLRELLCPAWLLVGSRLEARGRVAVCGRDAVDVVMTRRPTIRRDSWSAARWAGPVEVAVDAELGILLRVAGIGSGQPDVTEMVSLDLDPVVDPARFAPPPGSLVGERLGEALGAGGPVWWAVKTVAGVAAGGLGAWIKYASQTRAWEAANAGAGEDADAAIPCDDPAPELSPGGVPSGPPVPEEVLRLLHAGGTGAFAATLHQWLDIGAMTARAPESARRAGFGGLGLLLDAVSELPAATHLVSAVRVAGPGQYQVDHRYQPKHGAATIASDGQRCWRVYADKIAVGPAASAPDDVADVADPSWLLECRLSGGGQVAVDGRRAYRVNVARAAAPWSPAVMFPAAVAVVDAELGVLLRLTSYLGDRPVRKYELREVSTDVGEFNVDLPPDLPVVDAGQFDDLPAGPPARPPNIALKLAGDMARLAATEAAKAARGFLRRVSAGAGPSPGGPGAPGEG